MSATVPYQHLFDNGDTPQPVIIRFECCNNDYVMADYYCTEPGCDCYKVDLVFAEFEEQAISDFGTFFISLNAQTWTVIDTKSLIDGFNVAPLVIEFMEKLPQFKQRFSSLVDRARKQRNAPPAEEKPLDIVQLIQDGISVGYCEIFGDEQQTELAFDYGGASSYEIDDQYCMNPRCPCKEVILTFIKIDKANDQAAIEFIIRQKLNSLDYEIENMRCDQSRLRAVLQRFWASRPDARKVFKTRYEQMKNAGKDHLKKTPKLKPQSTLTPVAFGRNEPCPCGSGKKYKRCCGAG